MPPTAVEVLFDDYIIPASVVVYLMTGDNKLCGKYVYRRWWRPIPVGGCSSGSEQRRNCLNVSEEEKTNKQTNSGTPGFDLPTSSICIRMIGKPF